METAEMIRNLGEIYEMLGDELSKQRYLDRLNWLVTGDFRYVRRIVERSHPSIPVSTDTTMAEKKRPYRLFPLLSNNLYALFLYLSYTRFGWSRESRLTLPLPYGVWYLEKQALFSSASHP